MKLTWKNLLRDMCPICGKPLIVMEKVVFCPLPCGFSIGREKMEMMKYNIHNGIYQNNRRNFEEGYGE